MRRRRAIATMEFWNTDRSTRSNDADDWRIFDCCRSIDRSIEARRSARVGDNASSDAHASLGVSPLRKFSSAFCSPLREMDRLAEKKVIEHLPADPLPFSLSLYFYLFTHLFIYPFILFLFSSAFCQTFPLTRASFDQFSPTMFFQRTNLWIGNSRAIIFENIRILSRIRVSLNETTSVSREFFDSNLSFDLPLSLPRHFRQKESHRIFVSTFSYHSLNALPPFESRTMEFSLPSLACVLFFFFLIVTTEGRKKKKRKIRDAISLDRSNTVWMNAL